jgi:signal transduction histidine kinase/ligand-binding sensor domain-containing protein/CheY-like chemotaxis protein
MKMTFKRFLLTSILFVLFGIVLGFAQNLDLKFKHLTVEDGLSQSTIKTIIKDSQGFMWFGSENGLNKYDSYEFTAYQYNYLDSFSISSNSILCLLEDSKKNLWVGTSSGLNLYNRETDNFKRFLFNKNDSNSISSNRIVSLYEDRDSKLWIGTFEGGLNLFQRKSNSFVRYMHDTLNTNSIGSNYISSIAEDSKGLLWMANNNGNLMAFDKKEGVFTNTFYAKDFKGQLSGEIFGKLTIDSKDNIWIGTENGLFVYNILSNTVRLISAESETNSISNNSVTGIFEDNDGLYWILTDHGGVNLYNSKTNKFNYLKNNPEDNTTISNDQVYAFYKDNEGNYWMGNYNGGVNVLYKDQNKFEVYTCNSNNTNSLSFPSVIALCESKNGNIWIGTDGGGLDLFDPQKKTFQHFAHSSTQKNSLSSNIIISICEDDEGGILAGTYQGGLNYFDRKNNKFIRYRHDAENENSIPHDNIWSIVEDSKDNFWLGTNGGGLSHFDRRNNIFKNYRHSASDKKSLSDDDIQVVFKDSKGQLWIGSGSSGLNKFDKTTETFISYKNDPEDSSSICNSRICTLFEDNKGFLWIGTAGGLSKMNSSGNTFTNFTTKDGLPDNFIKSITEDNEGNLWLGTNNGLAKFNPNTLTVNNYDVRDGLPSNEFNKDVALNSKSGKIYFGGLKGLISFNPTNIRENKVVPNIVFTDFLIFNKPVLIGTENSPLKAHISKTSSIKLSHDLSVFTIKYAALNFSIANKSQYAYKMQGFDKDWNYVGNERKATYTNLDAGEYVFRVKCTNNDGVWDEEGTSISIIITPPFWETWWFRLIGIVIVLLIVYLAYLYRVRSIQIQKEKLKREVEERTNQLYEANTQLEELYQEVIQQREELIVQTEHQNVTNKALEVNQKELMAQAEVLAQMNAKLEENTIELSVHKNNLEQTVKIRTAELVKSKEKAEESDKLKSAFLANMSHEIRTPMNAIVGFSDLLSNMIDDSLPKSYLESIRTSSKSLLQLINDILDLSKVEAGKIEMQYDFVDTIFFFEEIRAIFDQKIQDSNLRFGIEIQENMPNLILIDEVRLKQVLINLIGNSIKFTQKGFVKIIVEFETQETDDADDKLVNLKIIVQDSGIGMSKEFQAHLFESFSQQDGQSNKKYGGTGLGLAISKKLVEIMNGKIEVYSEPDKGTTFTIILNKIPISNDIKPHLKYDEIDTRTIVFEKTVILVVDDILLNRKYIKGILRETAIEIIYAENGHDALELALSNIPDLILTDIKMPILDGFGLLKKLKENDKLSHIPVIAISAAAMQKEQNEIKEGGFSGYIVNPYKTDELYRELIKYLPYKTIAPKEKLIDADGFHEQVLSTTLKNQLLSELRGPFMVQWKKFEIQQPMDEVQKFGADLKELTKDYPHKELNSYANKLNEAVEGFDISSLLKYLKQFPQLIDQIETK